MENGPAEVTCEFSDGLFRNRSDRENTSISTLKAFKQRIRGCLRYHKGKFSSRKKLARWWGSWGVPALKPLNNTASDKLPTWAHVSQWGGAEQIWSSPFPCCSVPSWPLCLVSSTGSFLMSFHSLPSYWEFPLLYQLNLKLAHISWDFYSFGILVRHSDVTGV